MKTDYVSAIAAAFAGVLIAYFICNIFIGDISSVTVKTIDGDVNTSLTNPDPEVFNYRALNPTVEVYVGSCAEYDSDGNCIENGMTAEELEALEQESNDETQEQTQDQNTEANQENS